MTVAIFAVALVTALYKIGEVYIQRSMRSFRTAASVWLDLNKEVSAFVETGPPSAVAKLAIQLAFVTGCGCFVRGVLMSHYLPRITLNNGAAENAISNAFSEARRLTSEQQAQFDRIVGLVMVYDSFRNPIQGWFFRRVLRTFVAAKPRWSDQLEARLAMSSVLSRKQAVAH